MGISPSTDNYTLGKGVIFFNKKDPASGIYAGERDLGNAPSFAVSLALEKLEHFSSRGGLKSKDKQIISQVTPSCKFTLDEINNDNLALLTLADIVPVTQASGMAVVETAVANKGLRIKLANRSISNVTVKNQAGTTTYVEGVDYAINTALKDDKIGRILILEGTTIVAGATVEVTYDCAAVTYTEVRAFKQTQLEGMLRFVSDNPVGTQQELEIWRVSLTPDGDTAMIGDDWSTLSFTGEILKDEVGHPDSPYMNVITV